MALYGLGEVHAKESRDALAREAYQLAIDVWPQYVDARVALGDLHARAGKRKLAEAAYIAAVDASSRGSPGRESRASDVRSQVQAGTSHHFLQARAGLAVKDGGMSPGLMWRPRAPPSARATIPRVRLPRRARRVPRPDGARLMARHQIGKCKLAAGDVEGAVTGASARRRGSSRTSRRTTGPSGSARAVRYARFRPSPRWRRVPAALEGVDLGPRGARQDEKGGVVGGRLARIS